MRGVYLSKCLSMVDVVVDVIGDTGSWSVGEGGLWLCGWIVWLWGWRDWGGGEGCVCACMVQHAYLTNNYTSNQTYLKSCSSN